MVESARKSGKGDSKISFIRKNSVVLSINKDEKIIKLNDKFSKISGYNKDEAFDKNFLTFLIPKRYESQWKNALKSSRKNKLIEDFQLPILTKNGHEIMISWSCFPIKISDEEVGDIDFVGTLIDKWEDSKSIQVNYYNQQEKINTKSEEINKSLNILLKANNALEKKNTNLEKRLNALKSRRGKKHIHPSYSGKLIYSLADIVGGKKRRKEFERMMKELDEREKQLNKIEAKIMKDKKSINETREAFSNWRRKLENLENEIYNRNKDLEERAKLLDSTIELTKSIGEVSGSLEVESNSKNEDPSEILKNVTDYAAALIQRGMFLHVNDYFAELLGYNNDEIIEKSFFDFIAPQGLTGVEKYYLDRLKGDDINFYETIFLSSENENVPACVNIKSTFFNGEKAEIVVITKPGESLKDIAGWSDEPKEYTENEKEAAMESELSDDVAVKAEVPNDLKEAKEKALESKSSEDEDEIIPEANLDLKEDKDEPKTDENISIEEEIKDSVEEKLDEIIDKDKEIKSENDENEEYESKTEPIESQDEETDIEEISKEDSKIEDEIKAEDEKSEEKQQKDKKEEK